MAITPADATEEQIASAQENHLQAVEVWRQASSQYRIDQQSHAAQVAAAHASHDVQMAAYQTSLSSWEEAFEAARQKVDRIAYSGKVPVNVIGATPGQYVIAVAASDGSITGHVIDKSALSFQQYQDAVGRVNRILPDGRAEVAVIIH
jgi:hypothetical protein